MERVTTILEMGLMLVMAGGLLVSTHQGIVMVIEDIGSVIDTPTPTFRGQAAERRPEGFILKTAPLGR
jgi:hypothetical protein